MPSPIDLLIRIRADAGSASTGIQQATTRADKLKAGIKGAGVAAVGAIGGLVALGKAAAESASRQEQAFGSLVSVYGKQSGAQQALAEGAAKSTGLSSAAYAEMSAKLGASLKNMGLDQKAAGKSSQELIGLGADLSAAFGGSSADAVDALGSALRGEADPAERYGLALSQTAINAELARKGQDKLTGSALQQAKAAAIMALATKQAGGAIGQFARESGGAAGSAQIAAAQFENTKASLGEALLPVLVAVSAALSGFSTFLSNNIGLVTTIAVVVGAFAAALVAVNVAMGIYAAVQKLMAAGTAIATAAQWLWNAALSANPIGLIVIAIAAFVAAIVILFNKSEGFRNFILGMWAAILNAAKVAWAAIMAAISAVLDFIGSAIRVTGGIISGVWDAIKTAAATVWNSISGIVSAVIATIGGYWRTFVSGFSGVIDGIKGAVTTVFNAVKAIIQGVVTGIGTVIKGITTAAQTVWDTVKTGAQAAWILIKSYIITPLTDAMTWIKNTFGTVATFFSDLWQGIVNTATAILGGLASAASGAFNGITSVIKSVLNGIIGFINTYAIGPINFLIEQANRIPFVDIGRVSDIPTLASGAGITAGEGDWRQLFSPGTTSSNLDQSTTITVSGALDPDATARRIQSLLQGRQRRTGVVVLGGAR